MDEAYAEFSGFTAMPWIRKYAQCSWQKRFRKVAGLAALRLGAVDCLRRVSRSRAPRHAALPVNLAALVAPKAALNDRETTAALRERGETVARVVRGRIGKARGEDVPERRKISFWRISGQAGRHSSET